MRIRKEKIVDRKIIDRGLRNPPTDLRGVRASSRVTITNWANNSVKILSFSWPNFCSKKYLRDIPYISADECRIETLDLFKTYQMF